MFACVGLLVFTLCITGCVKKQTLPEPATTVGLASAEVKLDALTEQRIQKVGASVVAARDVAKTVQSKQGEAIVAELGVAKSLIGDVSIDEQKSAHERVARLLAGDPSALALYQLEKSKASELHKSLIDANNKYEAEKAKKTAEYNAALKAKEEELAQERELRKIDAQEARKDKWTYLGGLVLLGGIAMFIWGDKVKGLYLIGSGIGIGTGVQMWDSPYFNYLLIGLIVIVLLKLAIMAFKKKEKCDPAPK